MTKSINIQDKKNPLRAPKSHMEAPSLDETLKNWLKSKECIPIAVLTLLLAITAGVLSYEITRPWIGYHDFNGAVWSNIARNYNRYGFIATKFGQVDGYGPMFPKEFSYYIHHPPLLPILTALMFRLFGETEAVARTLPLLFSLGTIVFIFLIAKHFWGILGAVVASLALMVMPMFDYFGKMVDHEALTLFFIVAATYFYIRWRDKPTGLNYGLFITMLVGGGLSGWPAYYFMAAIFILDIILSRKIRKSALAIPMTGILLFTFFAAHIVILKGLSVALSDVSHIFKLRTGRISGAEAGGFTWASLWERTRFRLMSEITWPAILLFFMGTGRALFRKGNKERLFLGINAVLLFVGFLHILLFPHGAWNHDYWYYYLLAPIALSAAACVAAPPKPLKLALPVVILLLSISLYQGIPMTKTLYKADYNENRKNFGDSINLSTSFEDRVLANIAYYGPEASYYADRRILWGIDSMKELKDAETSHKGMTIYYIDAGASEDIRRYLYGIDRMPEKYYDIGIQIFRLSGLPETGN